MMKNEGFLHELGLQPGDVVECVRTSVFWSWTVGGRYTVDDKGCIQDDTKPITSWLVRGANVLATFRVVSRAATPADDEGWGEWVHGQVDGAVSDYECECVNGFYRERYRPRRDLPQTVTGTVTVTNGVPDFSTWKVSE